jgi:PKD repeat protein
VATGWVDVWDYVNEAPIIEELTAIPVDEEIFEFKPIVRDQELLTYLWDFGDGNGSTFPRPVHEYAEAGIYSISLTISDGEFSATTSGSVDTQDSENVPPVANAGPDITAAAGEIITLDGSQSNDPDGFPLPSMRYTWSSAANLDISDRSEAIATVVAPNEPGTYEIELLVNDGDISVTDTMILTVTDT